MPYEWEGKGRSGVALAGVTADLNVLYELKAQERKMSNQPELLVWGIALYHY